MNPRDAKRHQLSKLAPSTRKKRKKLTGKPVFQPLGYPGARKSPSEASTTII